MQSLLQIFGLIGKKLKCLYKRLYDIFLENGVAGIEGKCAYKNIAGEYEVVGQFIELEGCLVAFFNCLVELF
jgi:hypothetical protein